MRLAASYGEFVKRCADATLVKLVRAKHVFKINRRPLIAGAFAVAKDSHEDRSIPAATPINAMLDMRKVAKPVFANMARLRCAACSGSKRLRVTKRDARHYFHCLRLHPRWQKYLAMPPLRDAGEEIYPVRTTAPMGFAPSACWAQGLSEKCVCEAGWPDESRLIASKAAPLTFPVWGEHHRRCLVH